MFYNWYCIVYCDINYFLNKVLNMIVLVFERKDKYCKLCCLIFNYNVFYDVIDFILNYGY